MTRSKTSRKSGAEPTPLDEPHKMKLRDQIVAMLGIERRILGALEAVSPQLKGNAESSALLGRIRSMAEDHTEALRIRMMGIDVREPDLLFPPASSEAAERRSGKPQGATMALQELYALLSQATFGYSILHVVAHRQLDSSWAIEEGNTADLAEELLKDYAHALEILDTKGCEVAVWELSNEGLECRCVCPSCALGICLCWVHGTATVVDARRPLLARAGAPSAAGLPVSSPRTDSVTVLAGVGGGDAIVAIDDQPVGGDGDVGAMIGGFQTAIRAHGPGDTIRLKVRDPSGNVRDVQLARDVADPPPKERRLAAIVFTDMVSFTALAQADESRALELLEEHRALVRAALPRHRGREVKTMGDAFLLEFKSALDATACALEVQRAVRKRNQVRRRDPIQLRIGIHVGDLVSVSGDIFGDAVNIASRIEPMAEPGGICVSQQVYDQVWNKVPVKMVEMAKCRLKNVSAPIGVYRVSVPTSR
jgi:class 3 adenylate cyclase